MFDGKDMIGQAHGLSGGEGEGVKCVGEEKTGLEVVADEVCAHWLDIIVQFLFHEVFRHNNEPSKNFKIQETKNSFHPSVFIWSRIFKAK